MMVPPGQRHERTHLAAVLAGIRVPRGDPARRRTLPDRVLAGTGDRSPSGRRLLRQHGRRHVIPARAVQRRLPFDRAAYRRRNVVERCVSRRKPFRGLATRDAERTVNDRALVVIAALVRWLR